MTGPVDIEEGRRLLDAERAMDPLRDTTDGRQAVREFAYWLWRECISVEKGEQ